jgi:hypothetical protein
MPQGVGRKSPEEKQGAEGMNSPLWKRGARGDFFEILFSLRKSRQEIKTWGSNTRDPGNHILFEF